MRLSGETANFQLDIQLLALANTVTPMFGDQVINLRTILGDMYYRYNKFYIVFNSTNSWTPGVVTYQSGTFTGITNQICWFLGITGLPFINNTLDGRITNTAYFPTSFALALAGYIPTNFSTNNGIIFNKPQNDIVTINVAPYYTRNLTTGSALSTGNNVLWFSFNFTIYGLEE